MKISRIDRSRYGAVLLSQHSPATGSIIRCRAVRVQNARASSITDVLSPALRRTRSVEPPWHRPDLASWPRAFCAAVAAASGRHMNPSYFTSYPTNVRSWNHTAVSTAEPTTETTENIREAPENTTGPTENTRKPHSAIFERRVTIQPKDEILNIVDYYDDDSADDCLKFYQDPYLRKYAAADGPNITVSDRIEDLELQTIDGDRKFVETELELARDLRIAIATRHRHPGQVSLDTIWELYRALPDPRLAYITSGTRHSLMAALASGERKDQTSMLRYFSVVSDVKTAGFALTSFQWNTAISFAAGYVATTTVVEVEAALKIWREMEREGGIRANEVTFNILFDAASKAGKFRLAEMIYREMMNRGFTYNRYHYVSLIHFFGLKMDSSGVRAAYREMVEAGQIVDTITLNCLIAGFIRCGEEQSAEYVYEKMKAYNKDLPVLPHRDYTMAKAITKVLAMFARIGKEHPGMRPSFQKSALLSPDLGTYRILINHYGLRLGNLSKVAQFLDEMKAFRVPLDGAIFLALFQSFSMHGGSGSDWSIQRLDNVWNAFLDAVDGEVDGLYISTWLAMAVIEAYARHLSRDELLDVYDALRTRWKLDEENSKYMLHFLKKLLQSGPLPIPRPWVGRPVT